MMITPRYQYPNYILKIFSFIVFSAEWDLFLFCSCSFGGLVLSLGAEGEDGVFLSLLLIGGEVAVGEPPYSHGGAAGG